MDRYYLHAIWILVVFSIILAIVAIKTQDTWAIIATWVCLSSGFFCAGMYSYKSIESK
jgi:hypothetical protein